MIISTNSSGSLRPEITPGNIVVISDHINFQFNNPLMGPNDEDFGSRFVSLEDAYDVELRRIAQEAAKKRNIALREGIYAVSYTHLRAHETKANLVCRLLLENKKKTTLHNVTQYSKCTIKNEYYTYLRNQ